jgi:hypothetical protein
MDSRMNKIILKNKKMYLNTFSVVLLLLFFLFLIGLFKNPLGIQRNIFFARLNDLFADFFNVLHYISEKDPYFNTTNGYGEKIYSPLAYLILYPFSRLDNFNTMTLQQAWTSKMAIMAVFGFVSVSSFFLFFSLNQIRKRYGVSSFIFIGLYLSYIFIFSVERGNLIIISAAFVSFYLCYYDSDSKNKRILAAVCLALAVALKIYPVLFGFLYFGKKQYKDIFFSAAIALLLIFIPFVFFKGGFYNIPQLINNIKIFSGKYNSTILFPRFSLSHLVYYAIVLLGLANKLALYLSNVAYILMLILSGVSICFSLLLKNKWNKIMLLSLTVIYLPVNSALYCGLYLFPVIILFFATLDNRSVIFNGFIMVVFIIALNTFQFSISYNNIDVGVNYIFGNVALLALWFVVLIASAKEVLSKNSEQEKL